MSLLLLVEVANAADRGKVFALPQSEELQGVVLRVVDVDTISLATLQQWLLPVEQTWEYQQQHRPKRVAAVRRGKHQSRLFND